MLFTTSRQCLLDLPFKNVQIKDKSEGGWVGRAINVGVENILNDKRNSCTLLSCSWCDAKLNSSILHLLPFSSRGNTNRSSFIPLCLPFPKTRRRPCLRKSPDSTSSPLNCGTAMKLDELSDDQTSQEQRAIFTLQQQQQVLPLC